MSAFWNVDLKHERTGMHECIMMAHKDSGCSGNFNSPPRISFSLNDFGSGGKREASFLDARNFTIGTSPCSSSSFLSKMDSAAATQSAIGASSQSSVTSTGSSTDDKASGPVRFFIGPPPTSF